MIPHDHISIDGDTALLVVKAYSLPLVDLRSAHEMPIDRPCDSCDGGAHTPKGEIMRGMIEVGGKVGDNYKPCSDCDGSGRHTFEIVVSFDDGRKVSNKLMDEARIRTLTVSVVEVLRIRDNETDSDPPNHSGDVFMCADGSAYVDTETDHMTDIDLPPAAEPGMWAVRLAVHT